MANQSPDRREVLEMLALATFASRFQGFSKWVCAPQHAVEDSVHPQAAVYKPRFFTEPEFACLEQLTELIIPKDDTPGAKDAGVAEFIDFMAAADGALQQPLRDGIRGMGGASFAALPHLEQVDRLLNAPKPFFQLLRKYTVMGYYTSRIGLEELDYPGLKFYSESPGCPHDGDPEHMHLPAPRF
jgi:hypothetical protein